jgi:hypothetical protein
MEHQTPGLAQNASKAVIAPIAGLLGGLFVGGLRARGRGPDEFAQIACVVQWGITGFFAGLALVVLLALLPRRRILASTRNLIVLVIVAGILAWFFARIFFGVIGGAGY